MRRIIRMAQKSRDILVFIEFIDIAAADTSIQLNFIHL